MNEIKPNVFLKTIIAATLNSYSVVFFFNSKIMSLILLLVTFLNPGAGLAGLISVLIAVFTANSLNFDKLQLEKGLFSFNALLTGIGMGTFFDPSWVFFALLAIASLITLILSIVMNGWLGKYGLPALSIPFVFTFWMIILPASQYENLGLTLRNVYWMNELYAMGGNSLLHFFEVIDNLPVNNLFDSYFRSISSIFFQDNLITGLLISVSILICSRITFTLTWIGFLSAYLFAHFSGSSIVSLTHYNIGANYIMVAIAMGGFFIIPSRSSYLWVILLVPISSFLLLFLSKLFGFIQLPVFSLPFSLIVILFVYFLQFRTQSSKLVLTPVQHYSPEINLYTFNNIRERKYYHFYFPLYVPFWGDWSVSQGHDGRHTHKGDWAKAFDFVILDDEGKSFQLNGTLCEHYYCYNKPVLAPADGVVEEIVDHINDNEIGEVDTSNNWGNTLIIRHATGLYTQLSHLRKGSFKVSKGDFVRRGDVVASCGNSGRSPEPHLHFQVQTLPMIGSKTIDYPLAYYFKKEKHSQLLKEFSKPEENDVVSGVSENITLKNAFNIIPNKNLKYRYADANGDEKIEEWVVYTDAYNQKYIHCKETDSTAYYINDGTMFYFTSFYGDKNSLLFYFYLTAYKIFLGNVENFVLKDSLSLHIFQNKNLGFWLHDFVAPFFNYIKINYIVSPVRYQNAFDNGELVLSSEISVSTFGKKRRESVGSLYITQNTVLEFSYKSDKINIHAICIE